MSNEGGAARGLAATQAQREREPCTELARSLPLGAVWLAGIAIIAAAEVGLRGAWAVFALRPFGAEKHAPLVVALSLIRESSAFAGLAAAVVPVLVFAQRLGSELRITPRRAAAYLGAIAGAVVIADLFGVILCAGLALLLRTPVAGIGAHVAWTDPLVGVATALAAGVLVLPALPGVTRYLARRRPPLALILVAAWVVLRAAVLVAGAPLFAASL